MSQQITKARHPGSKHRLIPWQRLKVVGPLLLIWLLIGPVSTAQAAVTMRLTANSIVVSGLTPGGDVVVFGRSRDNVRGTVKAKRHSIVQRDDDADGVVTLPMEVPRNGVF